MRGSESPSSRRCPTLPVSPFVSINGSALNYSDGPMVLSGNSDLFFNRSATDEVPAGFGPDIILHMLSGSYSEIPTGHLGEAAY